MLTTTEAAARLGVQRQWVTRLIKQGRLRATWNEQFRQWTIEEEDFAHIKPANRPEGRPRKRPEDSGPMQGR